MKLIDYVVREVMSEPVFTPYGWMVRCLIVDMGGEEREKDIFKGSEEEIREVKIGYKGLH